MAPVCARPIFLAATAARNVRNHNNSHKNTQNKQKFIDIRQLLTQDEKVRVPHLAERLNVSSETIRRDLDRLEKEGLLKKVTAGP